MITDYTIVACSGPIATAREVQNKIREGWQPYGKLFQSDHGIYPFVQVMVKYASDDNDFLHTKPYTGPF